MRSTPTGVEANVESFRPSAVFFPFVEFVGVIGTGVLLVYGGWTHRTRRHLRRRDGRVHPVPNTTLDPITQLSQLYDTFQQAMAGLAKLASLLDRTSHVVDRAGAVGARSVSTAPPAWTT